MKKQKGITLIALVITIIVLLILAGITIATVTGDNGIIKNANDAKEQTEIAEEKEIVEKATVQAMGNNKRGNLVEDELQEQLDKITDNGKTEVSDVGDEFEVVFIDSNRYYTIDKDGNVEGAYEIIEDKYPGDITVGKDGEELDGSEEKPYEIWCIEDLVELSQNYGNYINSSIELKRTLNFKSRLSYVNPETTEYNKFLGADENISLIEALTTGKGFNPIEIFSGTLDGQNNTIENLYIERDGNVGLINQIRDYTTIENMTITGEITSLNGWAGGFIAQYNIYLQDVKIVNCHNKANIKSLGNTAGGIIGNFKGVPHLIVNTSNAGNIVGKNGAGGILGASSDNRNPSNILIYNSYNIGNIESQDSWVYDNSGGLVGNICTNSVEVINSYNAGMITSTSAKGAIIGGYWYSDLKATLTNVFFTSKQNIKAIGRTNEDFGIQYSEDKIKSQEFVDELNRYIIENPSTTSNWKSWKLGEDGYPTFE